VTFSHQAGDTLPLTPPEWAEWGNPITDPAAFATIRAYSPYDNVRAQDTPRLVLAGSRNPRVTIGARKMGSALLTARPTAMRRAAPSISTPACRRARA